MAKLTLPSEQYFAENFVESAGAILFKLSTKHVCINHQLIWDEYILAKGRRNVGETRHAAALREVVEETGWSIKALPLDLMARCTPVIEEEWNDDRARYFEGVLEPFAVQTRKIREGGLKLIWWYTAAVEESEPRAELDPKEAEKASSDFYGYDEAIEKLTFENDREILRRAIELVERTYEEERKTHSEGHPNSMYEGTSAPENA